MAIPDAQSIMLPLLELAGDNHIHRLRDVVDFLADHLRLTDEERRKRSSEGQQSRFEKVRAEPAQGRMQIRVARLSARRASRGQKGREAREEREVQVELRWREVELADPDRKEAALKLCLVHVREETQPTGAERLELVPAALAHRGLAPGAEDGLQGGVPGAPDGGADRAGGDDQRGDRVAADGDDAAGSGHAGAAAGDAVSKSPPCGTSRPTASWSRRKTSGGRC